MNQIFSCWNALSSIFYDFTKLGKLNGYWNGMYCDGDVRHKQVFVGIDGFSSGRIIQMEGLFPIIVNVSFNLEDTLIVIGSGGGGFYRGWFWWVVSLHQTVEVQGMADCHQCEISHCVLSVILLSNCPSSWIEMEYHVHSFHVLFVQSIMERLGTWMSVYWILNH